MYDMTTFSDRALSRLRDAEKAFKLKPDAAPEERVVEKTKLQALSEKLYGTPHGFSFLTSRPELRAERGSYIVPSANMGVVTEKPTKQKTATAAMAGTVATLPVKQNPVAVNVANTISAVREDTSFVPRKAKNFIPFGCYDIVEKIVGSNKFFPIYITGLSGNGKTFMVEQACASKNRELVRVNITIETDESDLLGGWTLVNGETKYQYGPVVEAMRRGAVLLLDEYDLGREKIMALQPVMEGNPLFLKKVNEWITPAPGFTVIATANTKGMGESDAFIGAGIINEAALDRFKVTLSHDYPDAATEKKILKKDAAIFGIDNAGDIIDSLVKWAAATRETYRGGGISNVITTRRLVAALELYGIIGNIEESIKHVCERFNETDRDSLVRLFKVINGGNEESAAQPDQQHDVPF